MKKIAILGTGCPKCNQLAENTRAAAEAAGVECEIVKVTDVAEIMTYGVMMTPALAIDGEVKIVGKVPGVEDLQELLT